MKMFSRLVAKLSTYMSVVAGTTLILAMLLVVVDVSMRYFGHPITGIYDLVALGGAVIIGFSAPYAAEKKIHVFMEMLQQVFSSRVRKVLEVLTRLVALGTCLLIAWNLIKLGDSFHLKGEVSLTIQIAYYPVAYGLGVCFFIQTLVYAAQIFQVFSGGDNE